VDAAGALLADYPHRAQLLSGHRTDPETVEQFRARAPDFGIVRQRD
jgi:hypothetical protein